MVLRLCPSGALASPRVLARKANPLDPEIRVLTNALLPVIQMPTHIGEALKRAHSSFYEEAERDPDRRMVLSQGRGAKP